MDLKIFYWQIFGGAASKHIGLPVCLSIRLFQLASVEVSLTILMSNIVGEYPGVFYNYPGTKINSTTLRLFILAKLCHT